MSSAESPGDRLLLRRIHRSQYKPTQPIEVLPVAFRPNENDGEGLSLFLTAEYGGVTPERLVANARRPDEYIVVAIWESALRRLGLTVVEDDSPDAERGHVVIPEINSGDYSRGGEHKRRIKEWGLKLAELASKGVVLP